MKSDARYPEKKKKKKDIANAFGNDAFVEDWSRRNGGGGDRGLGESLFFGRRTMRKREDGAAGKA